MGSFYVILIPMKRYINNTPYNIYHFTTKKWSHPVHNHTYFEIIFILQGSGIHNINGNNIRYDEGDTFLLGPEDFHSFDIMGETEFCFIRFNESFTRTLAEGENKEEGSVLETLLRTSSQSRGSIVRNPKDKIRLRTLLSILEEEYPNYQSPYYEMVRNNLMRSIMLILARNLRFSDQFVQASNYNGSVEVILTYIKKNIYSPSKLTIAHLADQFNYAPSYVSGFFKKHIGESIKQYIIKYKMKLIEARLIYSQMTLSEIAYEFSFTDESHFCKQFRKYYGTTPTEFRKRN